eukprot:COSAG06_NODE_37640_length_432_cov_6.102102_1_plen_33_part_01
MAASVRFRGGNNGCQGLNPDQPVVTWHTLVCGQ